jgi:hypothetical protein
LPWPWDARLATTAPAPPSKVIGDLRTQTIGASRGTLIGATRGKARPFGLTQGFMLLPQADASLLVARKQTNLENLYPSTAEYDSAPVYRERTFQFRPTGGLGESVQSAAGDRHYHYGINVWVTGALFGKGPLVHPVNPPGMPPSADDNFMVRRFAEARRGIADALFYIANQAVYVRTDDTDAGQVRLHERPTHRPVDMVRFTGAYAGAQDCLYVAWEDGILEEHRPDDSWTTVTLPANFDAHFLEVVGDELWAADRTRSIIRKCTDDPKLAGSWSGPILVGTPSIPITAIRQSTNRLVIFKADGRLFTINGDGSDNDLYPGLEATQDNDNARTVSSWLGSLWFRSGRAWYQLDLQGGATLMPRGPGRNLGNLSEVRGPVQCLAGWNSQMAFCAIYNESLGNSYLLSYGSWVPRADPESQSVTASGTAYTFVDQYDGALKKWAGRKVTSMYVSNVPTEARLYVGFKDGAYDWIKLVPYPLVPGMGSEYTIDESYMVLPLHHAMFQSDNKHWTGASIFGPTMAPGNSVRLSYRVIARSVDTGQTPAGAFLDWGPALTSNGMRLNPERPVAGKALELKVALDNSVNTDTPVLEGVGLHERLVPAFRRDYMLTVNANEYIARRDGASTRQSGVTIRKWLEAAASAPASITLELPDETVNDVALFSYEERMAAHNQRGGQGFAISVQATQFTVISVYGTIGRTRGTLIGDTRGYTIASMRFF